MRAPKQSRLSVYKGSERCTFPHLMNADKVRADNQTGITKGISLTERFTLICQILPSALWLVESSPKNANKKVTLHRATPPTNPSIPPTSPSLICVPTPHPHPSTTSLSPSRSLPVASRLAVTHLAPPEAHSRRLVCEEGQEFRLGWGSIPPSAQRRPALRVYNYLPLAFSTGSSTVQALAPACGDALGYTLGD